MTVVPVIEEHATAVDQASLENAVVELRLRGWSLKQIADDVGHERSTISQVLKRLEEGTLREGRLTSVRAWELRRLDAILERIWSLLDPDDPDASPDPEAVWAFLALSKRRSALVGMDVRPAQTLLIDASHRMPSVTEDRRRATRLQWISTPPTR